MLYRGGAEKKIRKYLVDNNYVDTVIQLPADLFFGTTIATCVIVLKKSKADNRGLSSTARPSNARATRTASPRTTGPRSWRPSPHGRRPTTSPGSSVPRNSRPTTTTCPSPYVQPVDTREQVDITELNARIAQIVREQQLRDQIDAIVADLEDPEPTDEPELTAVEDGVA